MDGHGNMNMRNYYCYEPAIALNGHRPLGLQLMPTTDEKPLLGGRNHPSLMVPANGAAYRHPVGLSGSEMPIDYMRKAWIASNERYFGALHGNLHHHHRHPSNYVMFAEASTSQPMQVFPQPELAKDETVLQVEEKGPEVDQGGSVVPTKKRSASKAPKSPKAKKPTRAPRAPRDESTPAVRRERLPKRSTEVVVDGLGRDISGIPIPVCSCTGTPQHCYRWGSGGWQSACCTTGMSMYPLPMSTKRRGARIAGRKMSCGAFRKVLEKLASEGYNFKIPIDLRTYWAKHGTNKFVTIR